MSKSDPFSWPWSQPGARPRSRRSLSWLVIGTLAVAAAPVAVAKYGEVEDIQGHSPIPQGWVLIKVSHPFLGTMSKGLSSKPSTTGLIFTIMDVRGAKKGTLLEVNGLSAIPDGWVILRTDRPSSLSAGKPPTQPDWASTHTIKCLIEERPAS